MLLNLPDSFWDFNVLEIFAALAIIGAIGMATWKWWGGRPPRMFNVSFLDSPKDFPPPYASEQSFAKKLEVEAEIGAYATAWVAVRSRKRVEMGYIGVRFVDRRFFRWHSTRGRFVFVAGLQDAEAHKPLPDSTPDGVGGYRLRYHRKSLTMLAGGWLWLRVEVSPRQDWAGYLEFEGATPDGRRAFTRRRASVRALHRSLPSLEIPDALIEAVEE